MAAFGRKVAMRGRGLLCLSVPAPVWPPGLAALRCAGRRGSTLLARETQAHALCCPTPAPHCRARPSGDRDPSERAREAAECPCSLLKCTTQYTHSSWWRRRSRRRAAQSPSRSEATASEKPQGSHPRTLSLSSFSSPFSASGLTSKHTSMAAADTKAAAPPASAAPSSSSRSSSSSSSTNPPQDSSDLSSPSEKSLPTHDPTLKPAASILANPHEAPAPASGKKTSALKAAFIPAQPGRQLKKKSGVALGKSFQRTVPLPGGVKHEGGEVLEVDPRGREASTGDGVVLPGVSPFSSGSSSSMSSSGTQGSDAIDFPSSASDRSRQGSIDSSAIADDDDEDGVSLGQSSSSAGDQSSRGRGRTRTDTTSTRDSSVSTTSSSHSCAIRFAPLPVSGRLKRSTSITIGVAARSQMLQSQGSGRGGGPGPNRGAAAAAAASQQLGRQQFTGGSTATSGSGNGGYYGGGPQQANDVIDLGEEISKKAKSAWKKMLGSGGYDKPSNASSAAPAAPPRKTSTTAATPTAASAASSQQAMKPAGERPAASGSSTPVAAPATASTPEQPASSSGGTGDKTPRRPSSPVQARSSLSHETEAPGSPSAPHPYSHLAQGSHKDHFPGVSQHHLDPEGHAHAHAESGGEGEGAQTPRAAMQRRLSTGAFLGGLSLRHMQQDRRREFGGHEEEDREAEEYEQQQQQQQQHQHQHEYENQYQDANGHAHAQTQAERHPHHTGNLVTPHNNPEKDEFHDAQSRRTDQDDEEEEDEEELREAERLAEDSSRRGAKGAGVEVVHHS